MAAPEPSPQCVLESLNVAAAGPFPGSPHPVRVYRGVLPGSPEQRARGFEALFAANGWPPAWRAGIYDVHHFHATSHEVLGIFSGWVQARLGGPGGVLVRLAAGDAVLIPAGVAHANEGQSQDFRAVGAYPRGARVDLRFGRGDEGPWPEALPPPASDPVLGARAARAG